ncbi:MAG: DUF3829 domain-containing protein [Deltaproteobacteria bacterium]|nr:DUF3829 domain-containing protein [Deltaproteobacteria bacterium]
MTNHRIAKLAAIAALCAPILGACKEDPPPPPLPEPARSGRAAGSGTPKLNARDRLSDRRVPKIDPATTKAYRVDSCYFGSLGLKVARDAYLKSMGGAEPGPGKLPEFGDYPENRKLAEAAKKRQEAAKKRSDEARKRGAAGLPERRPILGPTPQIPFLRHLQSCRVAKTLKAPKIDGLDPAIADFEQYVSPLQRTLLDAHRYYTRKRYEKDDFKRSKKMHDDLVKGFAELDERLAAFHEAVDTWRADRKPPVEKLDEGGTMAQTAVNDAQALTFLLLADKLDAAAIQQSLEKIKKTSEELKSRKEGGRKEVHAKFVPPKLEELVKAAEAAAKVPTTLTSEQSYPVTAAMVLVLEAQYRALGQLLRQRGDTKNGPSRMITPRLKAVDAVPRLHPRNVEPREPKKE